MKIRPVIWLAVFFCGTGFCFSADLAEQFITPPDSAKPWIWYRWSGYITKEGIRADLESLAEQGFGGFEVDFSDSNALVPKNIQGNMEFGSPEFFDHFFFTMEEAQRLGLKMRLMPMNGWATMGGDWIPPEFREHVFVWDEAVVQGEGKQTVTLIPPLREGAFYRDIAVLAFPVKSLPPPTAFRKANPEIAADFRSSGEETKWNADVLFLTDGNPGSFIALNAPAPNRPVQISMTFEKPFSADAIYFHPGPSFIHNLTDAKFKLQVSGDGKTFEDIFAFDFDPVKHQGNTGVILPFPAKTTGTVWVLQLVSQAWPQNAWIAEIELLSGDEQPSTLPRIPFGDSYAGGAPRVAQVTLDRSWNTAGVSITDLHQVVDLSSALQPDGTLSWDVPAGNWVIARIGYTDSTKTASAQTAFTAGSSWEVNKFSEDAAKVFMSGFMDKILANPRLKPFAGTTFTGFHFDSWECTYHHWSDSISEYWKENMPYELEPWFPALLGFTVNSPDETRRFLWDYRRVRADMIGDVFLKSLRDRIHDAGLLMDMETTMLDRIKSFEYGDIPMTEFSPKGDHGGAGRLQKDIQHGVKLTSSAGHLYGNPLISAEAFLAWDHIFEPDHLSPVLGAADDKQRKFDRDPYALKSAGDKAFAQGVNHFGLHLFCHQPFKDRRPGITTRYGTNFGRDLIWWKYAKAWAEYLSRCQTLLQQGIPDADFLFCVTEDAYSSLRVSGVSDRTFKYELKSGYDFDYCTGQTVIDLLSVDDSGKIVLPSGQQYSLLVINHLQEMTVPLVEKIADLVRQGATVLAPRPSGSPSLADAQNEKKMSELIQEVWGNMNGASVKSHQYGKGRILWGYSIEQALRDECDAAPAMNYDAPDGKSIEFTSRHIGEDRVFFLSSQNNDAFSSVCSFNVAGKIPELWHPDTGRIETVSPVREENGRTVIPVDFDPNGSVFVVFRNASSARAVPAFGKTSEIIKEIQGPWTVQFSSPFEEIAEKVFQTLTPWNLNEDRFIKYFSGSAVYKTEFDFSPDGNPVFIDLGEVWNIAEISMNGESLPALWKPPFRTEISRFLKPGKNKLEIEIVNTWVNRVIGDLNLPEQERKIWLTHNPHKAMSPLRPAGLLGPVQLKSVELIIPDIENFSVRQYQLSGKTSPYDAMAADLKSAGELRGGVNTLRNMAAPDGVKKISADIGKYVQLQKESFQPVPFAGNVTAEKLTVLVPVPSVTVIELTKTP